MSGNLNTSDKTKYLPVAMSHQIFHFNLTVYSRAKIIFFKMGILTELLPITNLLIPPPNPAHTPEEEEGLPQQDYC